MNIDGLVARAQRIRRGVNSSFPFISGDNFATLADFSFTSKMNHSDIPLAVSKSRVFFCESGLLSEFLKFTPYVNQNSILMIGNGDQDYRDVSIFPENFSTVLLQNSFISDNKRIFTLPIGIENLHIGVNGIPSRFKPHARKREGLNTLLIGPFGDTSSERRLLESLNHLTGISLKKPLKRVAAHKYPSLLREADWVACPGGNGIDTHRVWESLYVGSKPIVLDNLWSRSLVHFGFPLLLTSDWSPNSVLDSITNDSSQNFEPKQLPLLWMDYWKNWLNQRIS